VAAHKEISSGDAAAPRVQSLDVELPIGSSSWVACRVHGPEHPLVFDGPVWAHTSPVYVSVAGQKIASPQDAEYFMRWIDEMLRVVTARNRFADVENRRKVEALFQKAQNEFRKMADAK
jgi:hypothetical protein